MNFEFFSKYQRFFIIGLGLGTLLLLATIISFPDHNLHLWFFDVGQGDSALIKTPSNHYFLIDGGPSDQVIWQLSKALPFWQRRIDAIFLSHPHADHLIGLVEVLKRYQVGCVFVNPVKNNTPEWQAFFSVIKEKNIKVRHFWQAEEVIDKDFKITALFPDQKILQSFWQAQGPMDFNLLSQVLLVELGNFKSLLFGDAEAGAENPYLEFSQWPSVDLIKVPHHGSKDFLSSEVLSQLSPWVAVISVGLNNSFKLPDSSSLDLLKQKKINIWRTDEKGTLEVVSDGRGWLTR